MPFDSTASRSRRRCADRRLFRLTYEALEPRLTLTATAVDPAGALAYPAFDVIAAGSPSVIGLTPIQITTGYGLTGLTATGTGQTIAIIDAYDNPKFVNTGTAGYANSDLAKFNQQFGLPDPPSFKKLNQNGGTSLPGVDPAGAGSAHNWEMEIALDVEWAHAMAPGASIILIECNSNSYSDLSAGIITAANLTGVNLVSIISMSFGSLEVNGIQFDNTFSTGHTGITYLASTGDSGSPGSYPAYSPNVVAVGGTYLELNPDNTYSVELAWHGSGGGTSQYIAEPSYQTGVQSTNFRTIPDVAFDASGTSGVAVYDSYNDTGGGPWEKLGGTSLAAPCWAGIVARANQVRIAAGGTALNGPTQTLPALYALPATDFHDITSGNNGAFSAGPGYDQVTGRGTPKADLLVPDLAGYLIASQLVVTTQPPASMTAGNTFSVVAKIEDRIGDVISGYTGNVTIALANNPGGTTLGGTLTVNAVNGVATFSGLSINTSANGYTLQVTRSGLTTGVTNAFNVVAGAATQIVVTAQPPSVVAAGSPFALTISAKDALGNIATTFNGSVALAVLNNPGGSTLGGTATVTAANGVASFSGLTLDEAGSGYTLRATSGALAVTTSAMTVTHVAPTATIVGPAVALRGPSQTFTLSATDPSPSTQAAGYTFAVNWGDGSAIETVDGQTGVQLTHAFNTSAAITVSVTATDQLSAVSPAATQGVSVVNVRLLPNQQNASLTDLNWGGTSGNDYVEFEQVTATSIRVRELTLNGTAVNNVQVFAGVTGRVIGSGFAGNDQLGATGLLTTQSTLDGGAGNNSIFGGSAGDVLIGGSNGGEGRQGNNVIIAGNGANTIYGNDLTARNGSYGGNNLIVGGPGSDTIYGNFGTNPTGDGGEGGHNLLVGGGGGDTIYASQITDGAEGGKGSILVAGGTTLDQAGLTAVLNEWTSTRTYATKIANIQGTGGGARNNGNNFLQAGVTVLNDGIVDQVFGDTNGQLNWLLYTFGQDIALRTKSGETLTDLP